MVMISNFFVSFPVHSNIERNERKKMFIYAMVGYYDWKKNIYINKCQMSIWNKTKKNWSLIVCQRSHQFIWLIFLNDDWAFPVIWWFFLYIYQIGQQVDKDKFLFFFLFYFIGKLAQLYNVTVEFFFYHFGIT